MSDQLETRVSLLERDAKHMQDDIADIHKNYVTKTEFNPIAKLVWGVLMLVVGAFVSGVAALVIGKGG